MNCRPGLSVFSSGSGSELLSRIEGGWRSHRWRRSTSEKSRLSKNVGYLTHQKCYNVQAGSYYTANLLQPATDGCISPGRLEFFNPFWRRSPLRICSDQGLVLTSLNVANTVKILTVPTWRHSLKRLWKSFIKLKTLGLEMTTTYAMTTLARTTNVPKISKLYYWDQLCRLICEGDAKHFDWWLQTVKTKPDITLFAIVF